MKSDDLHQNRHSSRSPPHTPPLEWIASGIGLLLTICVLGFIGWQALHDATSPPAITVDAVDVSPIPGGYRVIFRAHNEGGAAAAQVQVEGTLLAGNQAPETSGVVLDYIPGHSAREGGLFFTQDPGSGHLTLRASGFAKP